MRIFMLKAAFACLFALAGCDMAEMSSAVPTPIDSGTRDAAEAAAGPALAMPAPIVEPSVIVAPVVGDAAPAAVPAAGRGLVRAGVLTAGDIDDRLNLAAFTR